MIETHKQRIPLHHICKEKEFWLLIFLGIAYFYRPLFLGETFFFRDLYLHSIAEQKLLAEAFRAGEFPLWNPYLLGGEPFLGNIAVSALYPANLFLAIFSPLRAFNINIVLHFLLSLGSAYALGRTLLFVPLTSFLVGLLYGFNGLMLSSANLPGIWFDMPYLPLLLLFWHLFLSERKRGWFLISVFLGTLQALAGSHEPNVMIMMMLLGWSLLSPYPGQSMLRRILLWSLLELCTVGMASVIIFPTAEMVIHSGRRASIEQKWQYSYSLHPKRLLEMGFHSFLGDVNAIRPRLRYWGWKLTGEYLPFFLSIYWGWVTLFLTFWGSVRKDLAHYSGFLHKTRMFCALLAVTSLILSLGEHLPFVQELYLKLPLHALSSSTIKMLFWMILPVALLAGFAAERCFYREKVTLSLLYPVWSITVILAAAAAWFRFSGEGVLQFIRQFFELPDAEMLALEGLKNSCSHAAIIFLGFALLLSYRGLTESRWQYYAFAGLLVVDLLTAGQKINFCASEDVFNDIPDIVPLVRAEIGDGRFFHHEVPPNFSLQAPSDELIWLSRWNLEVLSSYSGYHYRIPVIFHADSNNLGQKQILDLRLLLQKSTWPRKIPILSAGAVSLIMTSTPLRSSDDMELIAEIPNRSSLQMFLYRNLRAAKRVEFVSDWSFVSSDEEALERVSARSFDPRQQVVLQGA